MNFYFSGRWDNRFSRTRNAMHTNVLQAKIPRYVLSLLYQWTIWLISHFHNLTLMLRSDVFLKSQIAFKKRLMAPFFPSNSCSTFVKATGKKAATDHEGATRGNANSPTLEQGLGRVGSSWVGRGLKHVVVQGCREDLGGLSKTPDPIPLFPSSPQSYVSWIADE